MTKTDSKNQDSGADKDRTADPSKNEEKPDNKESQPLSWKSAITQSLSTLTIEPVLFLHMLAAALSGVITPNLEIDRICRVQLNYSREECQDVLLNTGNLTIESEVAAAATQLNLYQKIVSYSIPVVVVLFLGPYCDKRGCRLPLLVPIVGFAVSSACHVVLIYFDHLPPYYFILAIIPTAITGGWVAIIIAAMSSISVVTKNNDRSFRFALMEIFWALGAPIGTFGGARLYKVIGFIGIFSIATAFYVAAFCVAFILIKDQKRDDSSDEPKRSRLAEFFDINVVKDILVTVFKKREGSKRLWLLLCIGIMFLKDFARQGTGSCMFLFVRRQLSWNEQDFSTYGTASTFIGIGGLVVMTAVGIKWLKLNDITLGIVSVVTSIAFDVILALLPQDPSAYWMLYVAIAIESLGGMVTIMARSMFSRIVSNENVGKVFTFDLSIELAAIPLAGGTFFAYVYMKTQDVLPGAFSIISAAIHGVILLILIYLYQAVRRESAELADKRKEDSL